MITLSDNLKPQKEDGRSAIKLPDNFNIVQELLERWVSSTPEAIAVRVISSDARGVSKQITYRELGSYTNKMANSLRDSGILPEQRIGIMLDDGIEFVSSFLAAEKVGAVPILINTHMDAETLRFLLNDSRARALFIEESQVSKLPTKEEMPYVKLLVSTTCSAASKKFETVISLEEFTKGASTDAETEKTSKDDVAFWYFTSGSTGKPKGVVHLHHDIYYAGLAFYDDTLHARSDDVFFSSAKLYFSAGMGFGLYGPLLLGASTALFPGRPSPETLFGILESVRPTFFLAVPTIYARMLEHLLPQPGCYDLSSVRIFAAAGEPLSGQVFLKWKEVVGTEITDGFGSAEVCHYFMSHVPGKGRPYSCGKLISGYEARIVDENLKDVSSNNETGLLLIKGESTFVQYWHMHEATKKTILGEWINTGDLVYRDNEGYFFFCGRADNNFKISGLWVFPSEVENEILATGLALECCVVPATDKKNGASYLLAYVVPLLDAREGPRDPLKLKDELTKLLSQRLSKYKVPREIVFLDALPRADVGKVDRSLLQRKASEFVS